MSSVDERADETGSRALERPASSTPGNKDVTHTRIRSSITETRCSNAGTPTASEHTERLSGESNSVHSERTHSELWRATATIRGLISAVCWWRLKFEAFLLFTRKHFGKCIQTGEYFRFLYGPNCFNRSRTVPLDSAGFDCGVRLWCSVANLD